MNGKLDDEAYKMMRVAHPLLRNLSKDNLWQYMTYATTWIQNKELQREDAIIDDPLLEPLARPLGEALIKFFPGFGQGADVTSYCTLRHYCFDRALKNHDPAIRQIVVIGETLDTRAFRMDGLTNCAVFEMHLNEDLMKYKEQMLVKLGAQSKVSSRKVFCTQLHDDAWKNELLGLGFDASKPTCWIIESTLQFLKQEEVMPLLNVIDSLSAPHSQLLTERLLGGSVDLDLSEDKQVSLLVHTGLRYGEDGGVFRNLKWNANLLLRRNQAFEYYGTMWDPVRFDRFRVTGEEAVGGPCFMVEFSKP